MQAVEEGVGRDAGGRQWCIQPQAADAANSAGKHTARTLSPSGIHLYSTMQPLDLAFIVNSVAFSLMTQSLLTLCFGQIETTFPILVDLTRLDSCRLDRCSVVSVLFCSCARICKCNGVE